MRVNSKLLLSSLVNSISIYCLDFRQFRFFRAFLAWRKLDAIFIPHPSPHGRRNLKNKFVCDGVKLWAICCWIGDKDFLDVFCVGVLMVNIDLWDQSLLTLHIKAPVILLTWDRGRLLNEACQIAVCCFVNFLISTVLNDILLYVIAYVEIFLCKTSSSGNLDTTETNAKRCVLTRKRHVC